MITVLAICKNSTFIKGIQPYLSEHNIEIVSVCNSSNNGLERYKVVKPDVVIMDANWIGTFHAVSGTELIVQLLDFDHSAKIIITTNINEPELVEEMKEMGASGYFYRNMNNALQNIVACIRKVYDGDTYF